MHPVLLICFWFEIVLMLVQGPGIRAAHAQHAGQKTAVEEHVGVSEAHYEQVGVAAALSDA